MLVTELAARVATLAKSEGLSRTQLESVSINRRTAPSALGPRVFGPSLGVVLGGRKRLSAHDWALECDAAQWLVTPRPVTTDCAVTQASRTQPYLALLVRLDPRLVADVMLDAADAEGESLACPNESHATALTKSPLDDSLADVLLRLVRLLDSPRDVRTFGPLIERELIHRLLRSDQSARVRQLGLSDRAILQVVAQIEARFAECPAVEDLARSVHLGVSSLHHRFKAATGTSPIQYLKRVRLREARRLMIEERFDAASAAYAVGYASASQFSRDYRKVYRLPPRSDVARLSALAP